MKDSRCIVHTITLIFVFINDFLNANFLSRDFANFTFCADLSEIALSFPSRPLGRNGTPRNDAKCGTLKLSLRVAPDNFHKENYLCLK